MMYRSANEIRDKAKCMGAYMLTFPAAHGCIEELNAYFFAISTGVYSSSILKSDFVPWHVLNVGGSGQWLRIDNEKQWLHITLNYGSKTARWNITMQHSKNHFHKLRLFLALVTDFASFDKL